MEKIYITGTGRCGTTFLIKLLSFLNLDTGYNKDNYTFFIDKSCNSGMERIYKENFSIIKNPNIMFNISHIINDKTIKIKKVIIPIRDYNVSANSRVSYQNKPGGLWFAKDEKTQLSFYKHIMSNYIYFMTKYDIPTLFLDFDRMISDKEYLFEKLSFILDETNITFDTFSSVYDEVTLTSKSK
jgi:hypothetical protein